MIEANELRIGNWINDIFDIKNPVVRQIELDDFTAIANYQRSGVKPLFLKPILLTPQVLEKCGFKRDWHGYALDNIYSLSFSVTKNGEFLACFGDKTVGVIVKHLHQLQNLYFALTGEELTYTP